jgi:VCBS repeat-containing protein
MNSANTMTARKIARLTSYGDACLKTACKFGLLGDEARAEAQYLKAAKAYAEAAVIEGADRTALQKRAADATRQAQYAWASTQTGITYRKTR